MGGDVGMAAFVVVSGLALAALMWRQNTPARAHALARAQQAYDLARHGWAYDVAVYERQFRRMGNAKVWVVLCCIPIALVPVFLDGL